MRVNSRLPLQRCAMTAAVIAACASFPAHAQWIPNYQNFTVQRLGLTGPSHTGTSGEQNSSVALFAPLGFAAGTSKRFVGPDVRGLASWSFNPNTGLSIQTGLTTPAHTASDGTQISQPQFLTPSGHTAGYSERKAGLATGRNTWAFSPATGLTTPTGFTTASHTSPLGKQESVISFQNDAGVIAGWSDRYPSLSSPSSEFRSGANTWVYNPTTGLTIQTGLVTPVHLTLNGDSLSLNTFLNQAGQVCGESIRVSATNLDLGTNSWVYNPATGQTVQTGLFGLTHTNPLGFQRSFNTGQSQNGTVTGVSLRYNQASGQNAWTYSPATNTTTVIGLTGPDYTTVLGFQFSRGDLLNEAGQVAGSSQTAQEWAPGSRSSHTWAYSPATGTTVRTGLLGAAFTAPNSRHESFNRFQSESGQIVGVSLRFLPSSAANGYTAWAFNPATGVTSPIGLSTTGFVGSSGYAFVILNGQNSSGQVFGASSLITGVSGLNGEATWVYRPSSNTTVRTGLTGATYTGLSGEQRSTNNFQNDAGHVAGMSERLQFSSSKGFNTWAFNPSTGVTVQTGLTGAFNTGATGYQFSVNEFQNASGVVAGYSQRISFATTVYGQDAWYFDPATGITHPVIGSIRTSDAATYSQARVLTADGFMLGQYRLYLSGGTSQLRAFAFRPDLGFTDLGSLASGGLTSNGWSNLADVNSADDFRAVVGTGLVTGQTLGQSAFLMKRPTGCDSIDFNNDGLFPDDQDLIDLLTVLAGGACSTGTCSDIDFNNDGLFPDDSDLITFLRVLAGGLCE